MPTTPYENFSALIRQIEHHCENGEWDAAAMIADRIGSLITEQKLPTATARERQVIADTLQTIAQIQERVEPLHADVATLLKAFGTPANGA